MTQQEKNALKEQLNQAQSKKIELEQWLLQKPTTHSDWEKVAGDRRALENQIATIKFKLQNGQKNLPSLGYGDNNTGTVIKLTPQSYKRS